MLTVRIEPHFTAWRNCARRLLAAGADPESILWEDTDSSDESLFPTPEDPSESLPSPRADDAAGPSSENPLRIPRAFLSLAELVACHTAPERWSTLYRVAWRLTLGDEKHLLDIAVDPDVARLKGWASAVSRDRHKMTAFVRFRKVGETETQREQFVAWYEPDFSIVALTAPFFARRFANMDWSILTPHRCVHWDGETLRYTKGVSRQEQPPPDALEEFWRSYYASIFNPARLKLKAMQSEMPKKFWRNLPEAPLIESLTRNAARRSDSMLEAPVSGRAHVSHRQPAGAPLPARIPEASIDPASVLRQAEELSLEAIREAALECRACPLHERATQVVFGQGPPTAEIMIIGEQPGDEEDLQGKPFVGPAGRLLGRALEEIGVDRREVYVTNVVKHFKWKRQGKRRLHQNPSRDEVHVCRPWVLAEILKVKPRSLILLGSTAAKALVRPDFAIMKERGRLASSDLAEHVVATLHPSYLLRQTQDPDHEATFRRWVDDLRLGCV